MDMKLFAQNEQETNRDYAYRLLRTNIMTLRLKPGTVIKESQLCKQLSMSRTPIHEAVSALKEEWLVEVVPQSGTKVTLIDPMLMKEGYNMRVLVEGALLREAAGTLSRLQAQQLLDCLEKQEAAEANANLDPDVFINLDDELHKMMYTFCGKKHTWHAIRGLVSHYDRARYLDALAGKSKIEKVIKEHRDFYHYLLMGLPESVDVEKKVAEHLSAFRGEFWEEIGEYRQYFAL